MSNLSVFNPSTDVYMFTSNGNEFIILLRGNRGRVAGREREERNRIQGTYHVIQIVSP